MPKRNILIEGEKRNRLTYIREAEPYLSPKGGKFRQIFVTCECSPDKEYIVRLDSFLNGHLKSCGCYSIEKTKERMTTHGKYETRIYKIYKGMKRRCYCSSRPNYKDYGGRGIIICDEWLNNFTTFYEWSISHGYEYPLTIDRIDNNGNYEPNNCQWITIEGQQNKKVMDKAEITIGISPEGIEYEFINKSEFARQNNLCSSKISAVIYGKRNHHKNWKFYKKQEAI
jgi:hypothetical protein